MTAADCAAFSAIAAPLAAEFAVPAPAFLPEDGWCVLHGLSVGDSPEARMHVTADSIRLRGSGLERLAAPGLPLSLDLEVAGVSVGPNVPDPVYAWAFEVMNRRNRISGGLSLTWDPEARRLQVTRAMADFPNANALSLTFTLDGMDLTAPAAAEASLAQAVLREAELVVETNGLFESYVLVPFGPQYLPAEGDIEAAVAGMKAGAVAELDKLPPGLLAPGAREALVAAIGDLPAPSGTLTLTLGMEDNRLAAAVVAAMDGGDAPDWSKALAGSAVGASWVRTGE